MWNNAQIKDHIEAAKRLSEIKNQAFDLISKNKNITELEVQQFIYEKFKEYNLKSDKHPPIIAFRESSANPHYYPQKNSNKKLKAGSSIMLDIWARMNKKSAPFADITWMAFYGNKIPEKVQKIFNIVIEARNEGIKFIKNKIKKKEIPPGKEIDRVVRNYIHHHGFGDKFVHGTGHSLGMTQAHGSKGRLIKSYKKPLHKNIAYTIEPGIYIKGQFGMRSEIDFYINTKNKFILTTNLQRKIAKI